MTYNHSGSARSSTSRQMSLPTLSLLRYTVASSNIWEIQLYVFKPQTDFQAELQKVVEVSEW